MFPHILDDENSSCGELKDLFPHVSDDEDASFGKLKYSFPRVYVPISTSYLI